RPAPVVALSSSERRTLARALRLDEPDVERMTIHGALPWLPQGLDSWDPARHRASAAHGWFFVAGSRYCPRCVEEGIWDIRWRSALTVVCPRHALLLVAACPSCAGWPRADRRGHAA